MNVDTRLRSVFAAVFGVESSSLTDADSPKTIEGWDSVNHIQLILAIEAEFGIRFDPDLIAELTTLGAIRKQLEAWGNKEVPRL